MSPEVPAPRTFPAHILPSFLQPRERFRGLVTYSYGFGLHVLELSCHRSSCLTVSDVQWYTEIPGEVFAKFFFGKIELFDRRHSVS